MSKLASRVMGSGLFTLLAAGAVGAATGCAKPQDDATKQAWSCASEEVPMGEVVRCTSSALTADGPTSGATGGTTDTGSTTTSDASTYDCAFGFTSTDCPPADTTTGGTSDGSNTSGGATSSGTSGADNGSESSSNSGSVTGGGDGTINECTYVPDLDYCGGGSGSGSSDGTSSSGGTTSGGTDCGKPNCSPPGQVKKGDTSDGTGASSSGGASSGGASSGGASSGGASSGGGGASSGGGNPGKHFTCTKDTSGNKSCVSTPDCAPGSHPSACGACVADSDGTADCIPPSEGGCWVTGGGFIEGASIVPAAPADGHDNFGGNAKPMKRGDVSGEWNHVDHGTGNHAKGRPEYIMCRTTDGPGPGQPGGKKGLVANQVYFGGHAQWRTAADATWSDGYWFDVVAEDHGEPGNTSAIKNGAMPDSYHFTIRKIADPTTGASGAIVYETKGDLTGGNIQLHPSNNGHPAVSSPLPAWVSIEP
jgi:hypothetical protein